MQQSYSDYKKAYQIDNEFARYLILEENKSTEEVKQIMMQRGREERDAENIANRALGDIQEAKQEAKDKDKLYGGITLLIGLLITTLSYQVAQPGGKFVLAWGAVIYGGIRFARGFSKT